MSIDVHILEKVNNGDRYAFTVWEPSSAMVILGRSSIEKKEVFVEKCIEDGIPIIRRRTGGGTVVLAPGMLVFSIAQKLESPLSVKEYISQMNDLLIDFLSKKGVKNLCRRGLSDICINDKKIYGCSLYMGRKTGFYQGVLLVEPDLSLISRYLPHPPKEPDYREGRTHSDFITSLKEEGYNFRLDALIRDLHNYIEEVYGR